MLILWILIFIISLLVLVKGADFFTSAAEKLGLYFGLSHFVVGLTIVAFGTSLPELASSLVATISSNSEIVIGNVLGSNIANIFLVLGITGLVAGKIKIERKYLKKDLAILSFSAIALAFTVMDSTFSLLEGISFLGGLFIYIIYNLMQKVKDKKERISLNFWVVPTLLLSGVAIYFGSRYTVESLIYIASALGVPAVILSASAVALGTSLPEVIVSVMSAKKGNPGMAIGNVLGSNVFNTFAVMGIPALFGSLIIPRSILFFTLPVMLIATAVFVIFCYDKKITYKESFSLLIMYILFLFILFMN